jgi:hypothetical protein
MSSEEEERGTPLTEPVDTAIECVGGCLDDIEAVTQKKEGIFACLKKWIIRFIGAKPREPRAVPH